MNRNFKIIVKSFSFILIITILFLLYIFFLDARYIFSFVGFSIATLFFEIKNKFWAKPLFIDTIHFINETITIQYTNPILKKGEITFDTKEIINFRNIKKNIFTKDNRIEFNYKNQKTGFVYLKSEKEQIRKFEEIISQK